MSHIENHRRSCSFAVTTVALLCSLPIVDGAVAAQVALPPNAPATQEFGIDAGMTIGLGQLSSFQLTLPAARARVGFFLPNRSRWEFEPAAFLSYTKVKNVSGQLTYDLEAGALYNFHAPVDVGNSPNAVAYVRPFIGVNGVTGGGSNSEFKAGGGLGVKVPWRENIAFRFEGNLGYGFGNKAFNLGAYAGVSVFTHRRGQ